jgi:hypothetical protein
VAAGHRDHDAVGQRLRDNRDLGLIRPLPLPLRSAQHLHPARPHRRNDVTMLITMVLSVARHARPSPTQPLAGKRREDNRPPHDSLSRILRVHRIHQDQPRRRDTQQPSSARHSSVRSTQCVDATFDRLALHNSAPKSQDFQRWQRRASELRRQGMNTPR